jgi:hypothetical protein
LETSARRVDRRPCPDDEEEEEEEELLVTEAELPASPASRTVYVLIHSVKEVRG